MKTIEKQGGNGKVLIDYKKGTAIKSLKNKHSKESLERYKNELQALQRIRQLSLPNIVEVLSIDEITQTIVMRAYDGELSDLFPQTKNNPHLCSELLIPIIRALKELSELDPPIFHRDLKPANILYMLQQGSPSLYISDFGCCYFTQDNDRQTPAFRAVGAQSYRAPEYDYGRVEEVTSKGDIYSIGKILWAMLNGVKNEIFPYTLWFPQEYNLLNRLQNSPELTQMNLIIAKCVSINPDDRPTYSELIHLLENVTNNQSKIDYEKQLRVKLFSAKRELELAEIRIMNLNMLTLFYNDFMNALNTLCNNYPDLDLLAHLKSEYTKTYASHEVYATHKIKHDVASYIFSTSYYNIYFATHYHPTYSKKDGSADDKYAYISLDYTISSTNAQDHLSIEYKNKKLYTKHGNSAILYESNTLIEFLENLVDAYIVAFDNELN